LTKSGISRLKFDTVAFFAGSIPSHLRDLRAALADEPADVVVGDVGFLAGQLLQELDGIPFAVFGISAVTFPDADIAPYGLGLAPTTSAAGRIRNRVLDRVMRAALFQPMFDAINEIRRDHGLADATGMGFGYPSQYELFLQLSTPGFEYPRASLPPRLHYVGPSRPDAPAMWDPPTWWPELVASQRPVVLVTQGTVATDTSELLRPALDGLADEDVLVVGVTGGSDPAELGPLPANARVERFVPFEQLLPNVDIYLSNGGFGGIQLALSHGVPIVAGGKTEDKAEVTARVAYSGVGVNLKTQKPKPSQVVAAVREVLGNARYTEAAERIQAEIAAAGRQDRAAELLEQLAARHSAAVTSEAGGSR